ncbi:MAG TPA: caspase family protein [Pyrinomonadaceae bacterium]|nr:caspase family protein [Pyrinomonadaceae bacterium]
MLVNLNTKRRNLMFVLMLLAFGLPGLAHAQLRDKPCPVLYKTYKDNRETNPDVAYEAASEFLKRCNNTDRTVKAWMDAYEKSAYEEPAKKTEPLPPAARTTETPAEAPIVSPGRYYALVIGNNSYRHLPKLETAVADARVVDSILRERYGFETKLILNAGRQDIFQAISFYRQKLDHNDNLLVYYAGHGHFDREADKAYWLPIDARREDSANWVSADDITSNVKAIPARHVLIVSDSCYSGTIYRSLGLAVGEISERDRFLQKMQAGKSRTLMASGGNEPVADGGGDGHSVFARVFLTGLTKIERNSFTGAELFRDFVQERVAGKADQTPEYNPLRNSGHESGDFVFVRKQAAKKP